MWARLLDSGMAYENLQQLLAWSTNPNLLDSHPPFQIDGNYGTCAGIAEMFCQGYRGNLLLLPALPSEWKSGHMYGLRAPGGLTVDIDFADGKLKLARLYARRRTEAAGKDAEIGRAHV